MAHKFFTDQTPSGIESRCNQLGEQGWRPVSSGFHDGFYHVHLYREEDWSLPFRAACRSEAQSALVLAIIGALEAASDPNINDVERVKQVRELLAPHVRKTTPSDSTGSTR